MVTPSTKETLFTPPYNSYDTKTKKLLHFWVLVQKIRSWSVMTQKTFYHLHFITSSMFYGMCLPWDIITCLSSHRLLNKPFKLCRNLYTLAPRLSCMANMAARNSLNGPPPSGNKSPLLPASKGQGRSGKWEYFSWLAPLIMGFTLSSVVDCSLVQYTLLVNFGMSLEEYKH